MIAFPDTSFLYAVYREQVHSRKADAWWQETQIVLPLSSLLALEFRQSIRLQTWLHARDKTRGFGRLQGEQMLANFESDLREAVLQIIPVPWPEVHQIAERLSATHTSTHGHRFADLLHVATALYLHADAFLTFDQPQRSLAETEGLAVPL